MTVEALIEFLQTLPKDAKIINIAGKIDLTYKEVVFQHVQNRKGERLKKH
jgi:hypothetical protein